MKTVAKFAILLVLTSAAWSQAAPSASQAAQKPRTRGGAATESPVMQPVRALVEAMNGRREFPAELFTSDAFAIDEFAQFAWQGQGAIKAWYGAFLEPATTTLSDERIVITSPSRKPIEKGGFAYVTVPTTITWTANGKKNTQTGHWTFVLQQQGQKWVIAAHSFDLVSQTP